MAVTIIALGAVFGLLARGSSTATEEFDRADLQAQARHALEMIGRDVMLAGTDLPPEFPAFGGPGMTLSAPEGIEIIGNVGADAGGSGPIPIESFDGRTVELSSDPLQFSRGELVVVYDDEPTHGKWMFGLVDEVVRGPEPKLTLLTSGGDRINDGARSVELPLAIDAYNRPLPQDGYITRVSVVAYGVEEAPADGGSLRSVLWRQVNWGERVDVALVEDLEIRYFVGGTVSEPVVPPRYDPGRPGRPYGQQVRKRGGSGNDRQPRKIERGDVDIDLPEDRRRRGDRRRRIDNRKGDEVELQGPPLPQPDPGRPIGTDSIIRGVRITVKTRSRLANLRGSSLAEGERRDADGFLRQTLSTRIAPRNLMLQATRREQQAELEAHR